MAKKKTKKQETVYTDNTDKKIEEVAKFAQMNFDGIKFIMSVLQKKGWITIDAETKTVKMIEETNED